MGAVGDNKFNALPARQASRGNRPAPDPPGSWWLRQSASLHRRYPALAANSPLRIEVTEVADILFVRELLGGLYFGSPRWWNRETNEAINTMRYTNCAEVTRVARVAFELAAHAQAKK